MRLEIIELHLDGGKLVQPAGFAPNTTLENTARIFQDVFAQCMPGQPKAPELPPAIRGITHDALHERACEITLKRMARRPAPSEDMDGPPSEALRAAIAVEYSRCIQPAAVQLMAEKREALRSKSYFLSGDGMAQSEPENLGSRSPTDFHTLNEDYHGSDPDSHEAVHARRLTNEDMGIEGPRRR